MIKFQCLVSQPIDPRFIWEDVKYPFYSVTLQFGVLSTNINLGITEKIYTLCVNVHKAYIIWLFNKLQ